jgi:hypothetical protein
MIRYQQVAHLRSFPEVRFYGAGYEDFSIVLLQAIQGEEYSSAQWRWLRQNINQSGKGIAYLRNLWTAAQQMRQTAGQQQQGTFDVLQQSFNNLQAIYNDAQSSGAIALDLEEFAKKIAYQSDADRQSVYRLSLSDLSGNMRKAMVYGVVTYFFRKFKFGGYRARPSADGPATAYPVLFVLEEARALIPKSSGIDDTDISGKLARRAMRELAYEGRKFSLGFGLISQKPSTVDPEVVSQSNTFILHQLKSPDDQQYVRSVTESMSADELEMVKSLGTGRAIVAGVAIKSPVLLNVYFRYSEEGIQEPTPISDGLSSIAEVRRKLGI